MNEIEQQAMRLQEEIDACGPQNAGALKPQVDRILSTLRKNGLPVPAGLRRIDATLRREEEDDFFDNMPV